MIARDCNTCRFNRTSTESIIVDGRTADMWEEWACEKENEMTVLDTDLCNIHRCPLYEGCTPQDECE